MKKIPVLVVLGAVVLIAVLIAFNRNRFSPASDQQKTAPVATEEGPDPSEIRTRRGTEWSQYTTSSADGMADIADVSMPLYFEDGSISEDLRREIEVDLESIYGARNSHEIYEKVADLDGKSKTTIQFRGGHEVPDTVGDNFYEVRKIRSTDHLVVTKTLSDAYAQAVEFREQHRREYDALLAMKGRINRLKPEDVTDENAWHLLPIVSNGDMSSGSYTDLVKGWCEFQFGHPSLMEFQMLDSTRYRIRSDEVPKEELLSALIYAKLPDDVGYYPIPFFWVESKWIAVIVIPGS